MGVNINLELTDHCNIKCPMCSQSMRDEAHGVPMRFMDWDTWRAALTGLAGMDEPVSLCPHWLGEPTIHPRFNDFVEYAFAVNANRRLFHEFKIHTNGVVFNEERARLLVRLANAPTTHPDCFRTIHFSIDSFSDPVYQAVKGADKRDQVFRNVERFLRVRQEMGGLLPHAHLAFVVQDDNAHEARAYLDHWTGILDELERPWRLCWDWPAPDRDAVYYRPLNCGDQARADALHAATVADLGVAEARGQQRLRAAESF